MFKKIKDTKIYLDNIYKIKKQKWPIGSLYIISTPIGNMGDLTLRAIEGLRKVDIVFSENINNTIKLLNFWRINKPVVSTNRNNETKIIKEICKRLELQERVCLLSDSGSPSINDPGFYIIKNINILGYRIIPIPGVSSITTALMCSGINNDFNKEFIFAGFAPCKKIKLKNWIKKLNHINESIIFFESPNRIVKTLNEIKNICLNKRKLTIFRELTKSFEKIDTLQICEVNKWINNNKKTLKGEYVIIFHSNENNFDYNISKYTEILIKNIYNKLPLLSMTRIISKITGNSQKIIFDQTLCNIRKNNKSFKE